MGTPCKRCVRKGLAILPVAYAVAPAAEAATAGTVGGNFGEGVTDKKLSESSYFLRSLPSGYIYVLYESKGWQGYVVDVAGYLRYYPDLAEDDMPASIPSTSDVVQCERQGKKHSGVETMCIDMEMATGPVYVAYSRVRWTKAVRDLHKKSPSARMQRVEKLDGSAFTHAEVLSEANLQNTVADYKPGVAQSLNRVAADYPPLADRSASAKSLPLVTLAMSGALHKSGLIMALWDPVGISRELNAQRNVQTARLAQAAGIGSDEQAAADRARKSLIASVVEGLLKSAEANPGPWYDKNYGPDRYKKHIDTAALKAALDKTKAFDQAKLKTESLSTDFVTNFAASGCPSRLAWMDKDYDPADNAASAAYERDVAACVVGSGTTKRELERVWWPALARQSTDVDSWFYRAIVGSYRDAMDFINEEKKWDKAFDGPKLAEAIVKELYEHSLPKLIALHGTLRYMRPANDHTKALVETVSTKLLQMYADPKMKQQFGKLVGRVSSALMVRGDVLPKGFKVTGYKHSIAIYIQKVISGDTRATVAGLANAGRVSGSVSLSNNVNGAVSVDTPKFTKGDADQTAAFMVAGLKKRKITAADLSALGLTELADLDLRSRRAAGAATKNIDIARMENPYAKNYAARSIARVDVVFSAGALFFQMVSFTVAMGDLTDPKGDAEKKRDGVIGLTTAVLSGAAAMIEISAAVKLMQGATKESVKGLARIGVAVGGAANIVEGVYLVFKGIDKRAAGDKDSGLWTVGSGAFLVAAGVTGIVGGIVAVGTVPVIGWALATLALLGMSIYCAINASSTDDDKLTPVEYWLDNGTFGLKRQITKEKNPFYEPANKRTPVWLDGRVEMIALQRVLLVVQASLSLEPATIITAAEALLSSKADMKRYMFVDLPRWSPNSRVVVQLHAVTIPKDGKRRLLAMQYEYAGADNKESLGKDVAQPPRTNNTMLAEVIVNRDGSAGNYWTHNAIVNSPKSPSNKVDKEAAQMRVHGSVDVRNTIHMEPLGGVGPVLNAEVMTTELSLLYWPDEVDMPELQLKSEGIKTEYSHVNGFATYSI